MQRCRGPHQQVHTGTPDTFYEIIPQEVMPIEYGGNAPSYFELRTPNHRSSRQQRMPRADEEEEGGQPGPERPISLEEEFARNPELTETDLEHLREWAEKQPHLPKMLDRELVQFLHSCYYRMEAAKVTADTYFTARTHLPEFFRQRDGRRPEVIQAADITCIVFLPNFTPEGHRVLLLRLMDTDANHFVPADASKVLFMLVDLWILSHGTCAGYQVVIDLKGMAFAHVLRYTPTFLKKFFYYLQEGLPWRLKGVHVINAVPFMDTVMSIVKPLVNAELLNIIHIHVGVPDSLYKIIPQKLLPEEYGGRARSYIELQKLTLPLLRANLAWFEAEDLRGVDESKRPGKGRSAGDLFGMEGFFRRIDID